MPPYEISSHETFSHDSIDSLGYDWERIANPGIAPHYPLKIYLPQSTEDVVQAIQEARQLGQRLMIRSKGHSSNDLILADRGTVLCTEKLNHILNLDEDALTVTVQSGVVLAKLDDYLAPRGYGLPVIGDHNHITAGGFASVGGISPASHRYGMFVDNVQQLEYVNWEGEVITCSRTERSADFYKLLTGTGQYGVITTLTCKVLRVDKYRTILENRRTIYTNVAQYIAATSQFVTDPGDAVMERGVWINLPLVGFNLQIGQFSSYHETPQSPSKALADAVAYGYLHMLGEWAGRLPRLIDFAVKYLGMLGLIFSPRYAGMKNIETFSDRVLDSTVGDPTRMFVILTPTDKYALLFRKLYKLCLAYRKKYHCLTFISVYVKAIRSDYLSQGVPDKRFSELMLYVGVNPPAMTTAVLEEFVSQIDDLCIAHGAFRYMHSRTVKDPERRQRVDPNTHYAQAAGATPAPVAIPPPARDVAGTFAVDGPDERPHPSLARLKRALTK